MMKFSIIGLFVMILSGCSTTPGKVSSSLVNDVTSAAPAFCSAADPAAVSAAKDLVFSQIKPGSDKDKAQQAVDAASFSVEATCNVVKAIEAQQAAKAAAK